MVEGWRRRFRSGIIASARLPGVRTLYRKACQVVTGIVGRQLARIPGVEAVYTRHSHPRFATFAPGQSDIDLTVVLNDDAARDAAVVRTCAEGLDALSRKFFFVFPQDARIVSRRELAQMEASPGAAEILSAPGGWIRIGGHEARGDGHHRVIDRMSIACHPEFNAWWLNVLQTHVLTPNLSLAAGHMRLCFRIAMKSQYHLQAARGLVAPGEVYLSDSAAASLFADDAGMTALIGDLEGNGFRASDGEARKAQTLHRSVALAAEFYHQLPVPVDAEWMAFANAQSPVLPEEHRAELRDRIAREESLRAIAECIIIYSTPHWAPLEYQIDLILRDEVPPADFEDAVLAIKRSFGGRTFGIRGTHAQITMIPRPAFEHPWFFLGTPFPFLHEHIAAFGETLFGTPPRIPAPPSRDERLRWCAQYFFFHRFTLRYRPQYVSKDCNFCQLVAVRLFLEDSAILTDAAQVRRAYLDSAEISPEERQALDFLMRGGELPDEKTFAAALALQSRECGRIEARLRSEDTGSVGDRPSRSHASI